MTVTDREIRLAEVEARLTGMANELARLVGLDVSVDLHHDSYGNISMNVHQLKDYQAAMNLLRSLGIRTWSKTPWNDCPTGRTSIDARIGNISICLYAGSLPPTCRIEKFIERIPKEQTVTTDDFVEVERVRVVCDHQETAGVK